MVGEWKPTKKETMKVVTTGTSVTVETVSTTMAAKKRSEEYNEEDDGKWRQQNKTVPRLSSPQLRVDANAGLRRRR